ncbi:hypothetical protein BAC1_01149 [uncultured bacterium]|nr:hypothetical protein BAC1_01149 [uncultured bacterium]
MCSLNTEQRAFFQKYIHEVENALCTVLKSNAVRFPSLKVLLNRFECTSKRLLSEGFKHLRQFIEFHNELCTAVMLLEEPNCEQLDYEPVSAVCEKRFDFHLRYTKQKPMWVEVKTIHPLTKDDWWKYEQDLGLGRFGNVKLILNEEWLGGEIYHDAYASRSKILEYVVETENKIESCLKDKIEDNTCLVFFSNGTDWYLDELEDFVFYYRHDKHHSGDTFAQMEDYHIKENRIILKRNIHLFAFMERSLTEIRPNRVRWNVRPSP